MRQIVKTGFRLSAHPASPPLFSTKFQKPLAVATFEACRLRKEPGNSGSLSLSPLKNPKGEPNPDSPVRQPRYRSAGISGIEDRHVCNRVVNAAPRASTHRGFQPLQPWHAPPPEVLPPLLLYATSVEVDRHAIEEIGEEILATSRQIDHQPGRPFAAGTSSSDISSKSSTL